MKRIVAKPAVAAPPDGGRPPPPPTAPRWWVPTLWIPVLAAWGWLAYALYGFPKPPPAPPGFTLERQPSAADASPPASARVAQHRPGSPAPEIGAREPVANGRPDPVAAPALSPTTAAHKEHVVMCLLAEDFDKAIAYLDNECRYAESPGAGQAVADLREFVRKVAPMKALINQAFRSQIGQDSTLCRDGVTRALRVLRVNGSAVEAEISTGVGKNMRPISFTTDQLPPLERSRWLGDPSTPERCAMKFILHMAAGDYGSARAYAANCGPLSDAFHRRALRAATTSTTPEPVP